MSQYTAIPLHANPIHTNAHVNTLRTNSTTSYHSSSRAERRYSQRPIQLRDPPEAPRSRETERPSSKSRKASAGSDFDHMWSWVQTLTRSKSTMSTERSITNTCSVSVDNAQSSKTTRLPSNMHRSENSRSVRSSASQRLRQAKLTAKGDMIDYKASRHSLWGEIKYLFQSAMHQKAEEKAEAARRRARKENSRVKTIRPTSATPIYKTHISNSIRPCRGSSVPPRSSTVRQQHGPRLHSEFEITRKPLPAHRKGLKEVPRHAVQIAHLPPIHKSVRVTYGATENSATTARTCPEHRPSHDTTMGDFMAAIDRSQLQPTTNETLRPSHGFRPCDVCGAGASPGSGRTSKGLWLCAMCRNPDSPFAEIPPRAYPQHTPVSRHRREAFLPPRPGDSPAPRPPIDESNIHPAFRQKPPDLHHHQPIPPARASTRHDRPIPNSNPQPSSHPNHTQPSLPPYLYPAPAAPPHSAAASYPTLPPPPEPPIPRFLEPLKPPQRSSSVYPDHSIFYRRTEDCSSVPPVMAAYESRRNSFYPSTPRLRSAEAWGAGYLREASGVGDSDREGGETRSVDRRSSFYGFWKPILGEEG